MNSTEQTDQFSTNQRKCVSFGSKLFFYDAIQAVALHWVDSFTEQLWQILDNYEVRVPHTKLRRNYLHLTKYITLHLLAYIETHLLVDAPFHKTQKINLGQIPISLTLNYLEGLRVLYILH